MCVCVALIASSFCDLQLLLESEVAGMKISAFNSEAMVLSKKSGGRSNPSRE